MTGVNGETFFYQEHLDELKAEKGKARLGEPAPHVLAMLVAVLGAGEAAALSKDIAEGKASLQSRFKIARRLFKEAKAHLRDEPFVSGTKRMTRLSTRLSGIFRLSMIVARRFSPSNKC